MKKIVFVLVVLLFTAPAWAAIVIDANQIGDTNQVEISYEVTAPDVNLPRAFGLDITVSDGNIIACVPFMVGECNDSIRGFGIFPGTIVIDEDGNVTDYNTPVGEVSDSPDTLPGLGTDGITIEMGSLYQEPNAPGSSGLLCTITVTEECTVEIAGNAARCGDGSPALGVVMENPGEIPDVNYVPCDVYLGCFPSAHDDWTEWDYVERPDSWCNPRHCRGDADGAQALIGHTLYWVQYVDLYILIDNWADKQGIPAAYEADFSHSADLIGHTSYRVQYVDLYILIDNWADKLGSPPDCLDVP